MPRRSLTFLLHSLSLIVLALPTVIQAGQCVEAQRLRGAYGLNLSGRMVSGLPYTAIGLARLGRGTYTLNLTRSINGVVSHIQSSGAVSGSDCGIGLAGSDGFSLQGQIVGKGKTLVVTAIATSDAVVASGQLRQLGLPSCTTASLRGNMVYRSLGYEQPAGVGTANVATGKTGRESFDGKGCSYYRETVKAGADITAYGPDYLPYTVAPDCTVTLDAGGGVSFYGVLLDGGKSMIYMKVGAGATRSGEYTRSAQGSPRLGHCPDHP